MLEQSPYPEKWRRMQAVIAQYPPIDAAKPFKQLVIERWLAANSLACLLQYVCLMTSTLLPFPMLVWLAPGAACGILFLRGYRVLTGLWFGCFVAFYSASHQSMVSGAAASIFTIQAFLLTYLTHRFIHPTLVFYHARKLLAFSLMSVVTTGICSLILIAICSQPYFLWPAWWLANFGGILTLAVAWVTTDTYLTDPVKSNPDWCAVSGSAFLIAFILDTWLYLGLPFEISLIKLILFQVILCAGTLSGLLLSISIKNKKAHTIA